MEKSSSSSIKSQNWMTPRSWKKPLKMCTVRQWRMRPSGKGLIAYSPMPYRRSSNPELSESAASRL